MSAKDLTEEELALLTEEERLGLEHDDDEGDDDGDGKDGADAGAGEGEGGGDGAGGAAGGAEGAGAGGGTGGEGQGAGASAGGEGGGDGAGEGGEGGDPPVTQARQPAPPMFRADAPTDMDDKLKAIDERGAALESQFDDGDLTAAEYRQKLGELNKERDDLVWQGRKAELAAETAKQAEENRWMDDARAFIEAHPEVKANKVLFQSFDAVVRDVTGDAANAKLTNNQQLEKAFEQWNKALGREQVKADAGKQAAKQERKPEKRPPVTTPNLGDVPSASATDVSDGRFAVLDRLMESDPVKYEEALSKLSDADRDAYLSSP